MRSSLDGWRLTKFLLFLPDDPDILTKKPWSIKDLLYGQEITPKNFAFAGTKWAFPSGQDRPILPARVANQKTGFASSFEEIWSERM